MPPPVWGVHILVSLGEERVRSMHKAPRGACAGSKCSSLPTLTLPTAERSLLARGRPWTRGPSLQPGSKGLAWPWKAGGQATAGRGPSLSRPRATPGGFLQGLGLWPHEPLAVNNSVTKPAP